MPDSRREWHERAVLAIRRDTPIDTLIALANDRSVQVRRALANNANCPPDVLADLAADPDETVQANTIANPNCPEDVLRAAVANNEWAQYALMNPNCPEDVLRTVTPDDLPWVLSNPNCPVDLLTDTAHRDWEGALNVASLAERSHGALLALAEHPVVDVRASLAGNPHTPDDIQGDLSVDVEMEVRVALAGNTQCSLEVFHALSRDGAVEVRRAVLDNPTVPVDVLTFIAENDPDEDIRREAEAVLDFYAPKRPLTPPASSGTARAWRQREALEAVDRAGGVVWPDR